MNDTMRRIIEHALAYYEGADYITYEEYSDAMRALDTAIEYEWRYEGLNK